MKFFCGIYSNDEKILYSIKDKKKRQPERHDKLKKFYVIFSVCQLIMPTHSIVPVHRGESARMSPDHHPLIPTTIFILTHTLSFFPLPNPPSFGIFLSAFSVNPTLKYIINNF